MPGELEGGEEALVKKLADMKAYLEKRVAEVEEEAQRLRSFLEIVDSLLVEKSFRRPELAKPEVTQEARRILETIPITSLEGDHLADLMVENGRLRIVPDPGLRFDPDAPPLRAFLVDKVLEPLRMRDIEAANKGIINKDAALSYEVRQEGGLLKEIIVLNYRDDRRLIEIRNAVRWTFRRMFERMGKSAA